jgi:hypothetical protein
MALRSTRQVPNSPLGTCLSREPEPELRRQVDPFGHATRYKLPALRISASERRQGWPLQEPARLDSRQIIRHSRRCGDFAWNGST